MAQLTVATIVVYWVMTSTTCKYSVFHADSTVQSHSSKSAQHEDIIDQSMWLICIM